MERALTALPDIAQPRPSGKLLQTLRQWLHNARTRRQLAQLGSRELADLGISHCERMAELSKPFWR